MKRTLKKSTLTDQQEAALRNICQRYGVTYDPFSFKPAFDLPDGWVAGWVSTIYVGCSPDGEISS